MATRIETATARALAAIKSVAGVPIDYVRGGATISISKAVRGSSITTLEDTEGQRLRVTRRDYLIDAVDLTLGEPRIGDLITDGSDTFEVTPLASGETPWRWHDPGRTRYRIHTVEA